MGERWRTIDSAPKDRAILGFGTLYHGNGEDADPFGGRRAVIYWDEIDQAWCCSTHTWEGPFFRAVAWTDLPDWTPPSDPPASQVEGGDE